MVVDERPREEVTDVLEPQLQDEILQYEGRWVAMTHTDLIAVGDSANDVAQQAAEAGVDDPIIYFVPRDGNASLFF